MISRNLTLRLLVAIVFIPLLIWLFKTGGLPFLILIEVLTATCLWEFFSLVNLSISRWQKTLLLAAALYPPLSFVFLEGAYLPEFLAVTFMLATLPCAFSRNLGEVSRSMALAFFGVLYFTIGFLPLLLIREGDVVAGESAGDWIVFLFATVWIVDTAAYFVGHQFGSTKLAPAVSPNKTVVGFLGGFAGALLAAGVFNFVFLTEIGFTRLVLPALVIALFGQLGDLVESIFKREVGRKDSSGLIPGHGGALDRFDSILFASPSLYLYLRLVS